MSDKPWPRLTAEGYELLFAINDAGMNDVNAHDLADALEESEERITGGPCKGCGVEGEDLRYGWCYDCVTKAEVEDADA